VGSVAEGVRPPVSGVGADNLGRVAAAGDLILVRSADKDGMLLIVGNRMGFFCTSIICFYFLKHMKSSTQSLCQLNQIDSGS
jgi:hypothetical protein